MPATTGHRPGLILLFAEKPVPCGTATSTTAPVSWLQAWPRSRLPLRWQWEFVACYSGATVPES